MTIATIHNFEEHRLQAGFGPRFRAPGEAPCRAGDPPFREIISSFQRQDLEAARAYLEQTAGWGRKGLPGAMSGMGPRSTLGRWNTLAGRFAGSPANPADCPALRAASSHSRWLFLR